MIAFIKAAVHIKCGQRVGRGVGVTWVLMSTQAIREIGEMVKKTHHVDPLTERNHSTNDVIKRVTLNNKEK